MSLSAKGRHRTGRGRWSTSVLAFVGSIVMVAGVSAVAAPASSAELNVGDTVHIGAKEGPDGTGIFALYEQPPATGTPDYWAYCIEHDVSAQTNTAGVVGEFNSYLGSNYFTSATVQGKVLWVLAHSYPALSLADFGAAVGVPNISRNDAIEATQYAIWRYTDLTHDASWAWETADSETAYWYLVDGANASTGLTPADLVVTASITPPVAATSDSLVGPFVVHTNQPTASVSVTPGLTITDSTGGPIDPAAAVDGQEIYLDLRGTSTSGSATVTVSAAGSSATGKVISVPTAVGGTPTADSHAQSIILVTPDTTTTDDEATVTWTAAAAPLIGTTLADQLDGDKYIAQSGGVVVDTVAYTGLEANTEYTVTGELMDQTTGDATGIIGSATFTTDDTGAGTVQVEFTINDQWSGHTLTAFEVVSQGDTDVASHEDLDDVAQTVYVADLGTSLLDAADQDSNIAATGGTVIDTVAYTNLAPDTEHTVTGELYDKADGSATGIVGSATFTSSATGTGTIEVEFTITADWAGKTLVAFETVTQGTLEVAAHTDINDNAQTVTVDSSGPSTTQSTSTTSSSVVPTSFNSAPAATITPTSQSPGKLASTGVPSQISNLAVAGLIFLLLGSVIVLTSRRSKRAH